MTTIAVAAALKRSDIPGLCALITADPADVVIDVGAVTQPSMITIEALARLNLAARRHGRGLTIRGARPQLAELASMFGLDRVLLQVGRQPEQGEQPLGVEEVGDPGDPPG